MQTISYGLVNVLKQGKKLQEAEQYRGTRNCSPKAVQDSSALYRELVRLKYSVFFLNGGYSFKMAAKKKWRRGLLGGHFRFGSVRALTQIKSDSFKRKTKMMLVEAAS